MNWLPLQKIWHWCNSVKFDCVVWLLTICYTILDEPCVQCPQALIVSHRISKLHLLSEVKQSVSCSVCCPCYSLVCQDIQVVTETAASIVDFYLTLMIVSPLQVLSGCAIIVRGQPRGGPPPERQINLSNIRAGALARRAVQGQPDTKDTPDEVTGFILSLCLCVCLCLFTQGWSLCCWELL